MSTNDNQELTIKLIDKPASKWTWRLADADDGLFYVETAPNWFHRQTQRLFLGIIWRQNE